MFISVTVLRSIEVDGPIVPVKTFINIDTISSIDEENGKIILYYKEKDEENCILRDDIDSTLDKIQEKLIKLGLYIK